MTQNIYNNVIILITGLPGCGKLIVAEALAKKTHMRFSDHHALIDPILRLFGDDYRVFWNLTRPMWQKLNDVTDTYLTTIADICHKNDSFIVTEMLFDQDPYHDAFFKKVLDVVSKRKATFIPVRLLCDEDELAKRVQSESRKHYFKTRDPVLSRKRSRKVQVYYSQHPNEITINNTDKSPDEVADVIIDKISHI